MPEGQTRQKKFKQQKNIGQLNVIDHCAAAGQCASVEKIRVRRDPCSE